MQVICWVLGEYGYLCAEGVTSVLERLADAVERQFTASNTRCWVMVAITKLVAQQGALPEQVVELVDKYQKSSNVLLAKHCHELSALAQNMHVMQAALPVDASCEDLEVDPKLGFLGAYVAEALSRGAQPYLAQSERPDELDVGSAPPPRTDGAPPPGHAAGALRFDEYERPQEPQRIAGALGGVAEPGAGASGGYGYEGQGQRGAPAGGSGINTAGVAKKWGSEGFSAGGITKPPAAATPPPQQQSAYGTPYGSQGTQPAYQTSAAAAPPTPPPPAELTEKEKMAAALFGGISGNAAPPAAAVRRAGGAPVARKPAMAATPTPPRAAAPAAAPAVDLLGDLLDVTPASPAQPPPPPTPPPAAALGGDLLSLMDGPAMSASPMGAPPLGAMGAMGAVGVPTLMGAPAATGAAATPPGAPPPGAAIMGMLPPMAPLGAAAAPAAATSSATSAPTSAPTTIATDPNLKISLTAVHHPAATELRLGLTGPSTLHNVSVQLEAPPTLKLVVGGPPAAEVRGTRVTLAALHAGSSATVTATVTAVGGAAAAEQQLLGQLTYTTAINQESHVLSYRVPLTPEALLRPHALTTSQFGALWPSHAAERKTVTYSSLSSSPAAWTALITGPMRLAHVDTIGAECISCGKLVGGEHLVLVHAKLALMGNKALELTVRSKDMRCTDAVHRQLIELASKGV